MSDLENIVNSHVPDNIEGLFNVQQKSMAELVYQAAAQALQNVNVTKMDKGSVSTVHNNISATATSAEIDCKGYSAILIKVDFLSGTGTWKIDLRGSLETGATAVNLYDDAGVQRTTNNITDSGCYIFRGIPDFVKVVATEVADGANITVKVQPVNA